ncbi:MAG: sodium-dependent bicarbonate transport family permease [Planctomycetota bacterium]
MPLVGGAIGLGTGWLLGLSTGGIALLTTLCASASYIAVPAAIASGLPLSVPAWYIGPSGATCRMTSSFPP